MQMVMVSRLTFASLACLILPACVTGTQTDCGGEPCAALDQPFGAGLARITPIALEQDSRCPSDAACVHGGTVEVRVQLEQGGREAETVVTLGEAEPVLSGNLTLTRVWPESVTSTDMPDASDYRFAFTWAPHLAEPAEAAPGIM